MDINGKEHPIVGIFMPAYNQGHFIDDAIDSLKKQTFQDFVVHIVDDGSNDGETPKKLESIKYDKAKIFLNEDNKGVAYRARMHYRKLKTKYIMVLCADDVLAPEFLEKTVEYMEKYEDCGAVSTNLKLFSETPNDAFYLSEYCEKKMTLPHLLARNRVLGSSLMRTKALEETDLSGGFVRYQDWDRWISMTEKGWKIGLIKEPLFYYRQDFKSLSHMAKIEDEMEIRKKLLVKHKDNYQKYYAEVILDMEYAFLEMKEGKDWLDDQYHKHTREIKKINQEIKELNQVIEAKNGVIDELNNELERQDSLRFLLRKRIKKVAKKVLRRR